MEILIKIYNHSTFQERPCWHFVFFLFMINKNRKPKKKKEFGERGLPVTSEDSPEGGPLSLCAPIHPPISSGGKVENSWAPEKNLAVNKGTPFRQKPSEKSQLEKSQDFGVFFSANDVTMPTVRGERQYEAMIGQKSSLLPSFLPSSVSFFSSPSIFFLHLYKKIK